ncbi:galactofuranose ABC transporter, permease protein YjfF [Oceanispirochaeta sp.]|jgi:ribose/xylose/arabinose/galactoside ABC-type transport system permease subunit|uniref:galactofuranose ABC transporter, permease protein YjfF n=1 Tax=Oceanispirochaeta sp. TaxID=2035350 RepID=UPI00262409DF|nr:galactofuranose ABC transporter, permease protein YjfF [Oceanispirochaeta sp.]MDA3958635.1 sugar ABC transporter permease YjfF [Oceanispirochaeta sp.]
MKLKISINPKNISLFVTIALFVIMFGGGSIFFYGFFSLQNFLNLFIDNSYLLILAVGMTFVIISGGIDLSVGSVLALSTMMSSFLLEKAHWSPFAVIPMVLLIGALFGFCMGYIIHTFELPPFIITLAGLYLARGLCYVISIDTIGITDPFWKGAANIKIPMGNSFISPSVVIALFVVLAGLFVSRSTKFGRTVFAIGGNEHSAMLMGLPVARSKIMIYSLSSFCAALAGIVFTFYTLSGYALNGKNMEMDAIATVVIGGTLLTGGVGGLLGTVFGVLVYGTIQILIVFQGTLNGWWTRIAIGFLVFVFCLLQSVFESRQGRKQVKISAK